MSNQRTVSSNEASGCITKLLLYLGEDPEREGLKNTPRRVVKSYEKLFGGYKQNPSDILKPIFHESYQQMVILKDIRFYSTCEHHMLPFFGTCHIGYIPGPSQDGYRLVGISKLARLVECFSRRLQVQERLTEEIATAIDTILEPVGVAVVIEAQHFCMTSRGVEKQDAKMMTNSMLGVMRDISKARLEFFNSIRG